MHQTLRNEFSALRAVFSILAVLPMVMVVVGCQQPPAGDLDNLEDKNNNGFGDIEPPEGVPFDEATNVKLQLTNTVGRDDLGPLVAQQGFDASLLNFITLSVDMVITLEYAGNDPIVKQQSQALEPFDLKFEVACPDSVNAELSVIANVPIIGPQEIPAGAPVVVSLGNGYECGQTLTVTASLDDNGAPTVSVDVAGE